MTAVHMVYPYKHTGPRSERLLRFSLRSACKHADVSDVTLIGDVPQWFRGRGVRHPDGPSKYVNACERLWIAMELRYSQDEKLVVMNDDFILRDPLDMVVKNDNFILRGPLDLSPAHRGRLVPRIEQQYRGEYGQVARRTLELLLRAGLPEPQVLDYGLHTPFHVDDPEFAAQLLRQSGGPVLFRTLYGNQKRVIGEERQDVKAFNIAQLEALLASAAPSISVSDESSTVDRLLEVLENELPDCCDFEGGE